MKAALVILLIACIGLGAALLMRHKKAQEQLVTDEVVKADLTNQLEDVKVKLDEQERIAMSLQTNLSVTSEMLSSTSNNLTSVARNLAQAQAEAKAAAEAAKAEIDKREERIKELTAHGEDLGKRIQGLNVSIGNLNQLISETERKLEASEGDREFLLKELKRLQAEKADLERQFNDLDALRGQVAKLKEELSVARRLDWIRRGIYGGEFKKGAELLMQGITASSNQPSYDLNVELKQDGTATIVPPTSTNTTTTTTTTNAPAQP